MTPSCTTCRWYLVYRCPCVEPSCRYNQPHLARQGANCPKYQERTDG